MPEIAIDKHGETPDWNDDVRFAGELGIGVNENERPAFRRARRKSFSGAVLRDFTRAIKAEIRCAREGGCNQYFR